MEDFRYLIEAVLSGLDPQAGPRYPQSVIMLGTKLKEAALRQQAEVRQFVEEGILTAKFHRGNAQMLLLYLDAMAAGARRTLQLEKYLVGTDAPPPPAQRTPMSPFPNTPMKGLPSEQSLKGAFLLTRALNSSARRTLSEVTFKPETGLFVAVRLLTVVIANCIRRTESGVLKQLALRHSAKAPRTHDVHWKWTQRTRVVEIFIRRGVVRTEQLAFWRWRLNTSKAKCDPRLGVEALNDFVRSRKRLLFVIWRHSKERVRERLRKLKSILLRLSTSSLFEQKATLQQWHHRTQQVGEWPQTTRDLVKAAALQLTYNACKEKNGLQAVILRWKARLADSEMRGPLVTTEKFVTALEKASRYQLRAVLSSITSEGPEQLYRATVLRVALQAFRRSLQGNFTQWKETAQKSSIMLKDEKVTNLVDLLAKVLQRKSQRCFRPTIIVKDADEILRRQITRMFHKRDALLGTAMLMWSSEVKKFKFQKRLTKLEVVFQRSSLGASQAFKRLSDVVQQHYYEIEMEAATKKAVMRIIVLSNAVPRRALLGWKHAATARNAATTCYRTLKAMMVFRKILTKKTVRAFHPPKDATKALKLRIALEEVGRNRLAAVFRKTTYAISASEALRKFHLAWSHSVKQGIDRWKTASSHQREYEAWLEASTTKLKSAVELVARDNLVVGLLANVKLLTQRLGWRLQDTLRALLRPSLKVCLLQIRGNRHLVNSRLRSLFLGTQQRFRATLLLWKLLSTHSKAGQLSTTANHQRFAETLKVALECTASRQLRGVADRLFADHFKTKTAITTFVKELMKGQDLAFHLWKRKAVTAEKRHAEEKIKAQKLKAMLGTVSLHTLRETSVRLTSTSEKTKAAVKCFVQQISKKRLPAIEMWRNRTLAHKNTKPKIWCFATMLMNRAIHVVRNPWEQLMADHTLTKAAFRDLIRVLEVSQRKVVTRWRDSIAKKKEVRDLNEIRALKLSVLLNKITERNLRIVLERCTDTQEKMKTALRVLNILATSSQKSRFAHWRTAGFKKLTYLHQRMHHTEHLNAALKRVVVKTLRATMPNLRMAKRLQLSEAQRLNFLLDRLPRRIIRGVFSSVMANKSHARTRVAEIIRILIEGPRNALMKWREFAQEARNRGMTGSLRAKQLRIRLTAIPTFRLNEAFKALIHGPSHLKAAMQTLLRVLRQDMRSVLALWHKKTTDARQRGLLGASVVDRLQYKLLKVSVRLIKSSFVAVTSRPRNTKIMLRAVGRSLLKRIEYVFSRWRAYEQDFKQQAISKVLTAQRLQHALSKVPTQNLNYTFRLIKGDRHRVKEAVTVLVSRLEGKAKAGLRHWRLRMEGSRVELLLVSLKVQKLQSTLRRSIAGTLDFALRRMQTWKQMRQVFKGMLLVESWSLNGPAQRWQYATVDFREDSLHTTVRALKLRLYLETLSRQRESAAWARLRSPSQQDRALHSLVYAFQQTHRQAVTTWRERVLRADSSHLLRAKQVRSLFSYLVLRHTKSAFSRVASGGLLVKAALRSLVKFLSARQRLLFQQWKDSVQAVSLVVAAKETPRKKASIPIRLST